MRVIILNSTFTLPSYNSNLLQVNNHEIRAKRRQILNTSNATTKVAVGVCSDITSFSRSRAIVVLESRAQVDPVVSVGTIIV